MQLILGFFGLALLVIVITDAFQTIVAARRVQNLPSATRIFYRLSWALFSGVARRIKSDVRRENCLCVYGPLSLLLLLACWALNLIVGFAILQWSIGLQFKDTVSTLANAVYFSASTFFTLSSGEPINLPSRYLMVLEAGFGFSFLGLVIGYLPVLYQAVSDRELRISLLDARAGSPPSAVEFLLRRGRDPEKLEQRLADWEEWALDLLQTHLSYPMLAYYRSQHANQSWLGALTVVIDISALVMLGSDNDLKRQAEFTFTAGRHALIHIASVFSTRPFESYAERLAPEDFSDLFDAISGSDTPLNLERISLTELKKLSATYEPYANALGVYFLMAIPGWLRSQGMSENWRVASRESLEASNVVSDPYMKKPEP
jgi:hypothetical protein